MTITTKNMTIQQVADRYNKLAQAEKWFEIQDEFFSEDVKSTDPPDSPYFGYAEGKADVRKKGEEFTKGITGVHHLFTSEPLIAGNYFAVGREVDVTTQKHGRIQINQIMLYEVSDGKIISEQFFY
jgi:hypothetical protein